MIKLQTYPITNNLPLTNEILVSYINRFWEEMFTDIKNTKHLLILCKVHFVENEQGYRTLGHLRKVNFSDKELYIEYLTQCLNTINDSYISQPISNITFSYIIREGLCTDSNRALLNLNDKVNTTHSFNNMNLPISMEPVDYGELQSHSYIEVKGVTYHRFIVMNGNRIYRIDRSLDKVTNIVTLLGAINLTWTDTRIDSETIMREIKKSTIYFMNGEIVLRKQVLPARPFRRLQVDTSVVNNFYTMDIETIKVDRQLVPYLICAYNGSEYISSYSKDQKTLFNTFFNNLISKVPSGSRTLIYAHNLSAFDGIFILKQLLNYGKVDPLIFNGKLISIKVTITGTKNPKVIVFKDSFLLLPFALRYLCRAFNVEKPKGYFPFLLTNVFYTGVIPKFEYWTGITLNDYNILKSDHGKRMWSFRDEAIKYCKLDCKTLHEIIIKFNELIFNNFKVDAHKALTLPALAMRIYKTHYMPEDTIYQLLGKAEYNIRESYL